MGLLDDLTLFPRLLCGGRCLSPTCRHISLLKRDIGYLGLGGGIPQFPALYYPSRLLLRQFTSPSWQVFTGTCRSRGNSIKSHQLLSFSNTFWTASQSTFTTMPQTAGAEGEYWLPGYQLSRHIVLRQLQYFLGPSATVRPYSLHV